MSPQTLVIETQPQAVPAPAAERYAQHHLFPEVDRYQVRYLEDSRMFSLKGGFTAEVIQSPGDRFVRAGVFTRAAEELAEVALAAFGKGSEDKETYVPQAVIAKNAIWVDWLIVVRKHGRPVAFGSATFISPFLLYLSSAMVVPNEQTTGVGVVANGLLWKLAVEQAREDGVSEPEIVCRTHNRNVASVLLHLLEHGRVSTEGGNDPETQLTFLKTANHLHCDYDLNTGVSRDVYPEGLPGGTKSKDERINRAFESIGPRDACYVTGSLNLRYIERLISRQVVERTDQPAEQPVRMHTNQDGMIPLHVLPQVA